MNLAWFTALLALSSAAALYWKLRKVQKENYHIYKRIERFQLERKSLLAMLHDLAEAFKTDISPSELLEVVNRTACEVLSARGAAYYRWNPDKGSFFCVSTYKAFPPMHPVTQEAEAKLAARVDYLHEAMLHEALPADHPLLSDVISKGAMLIADAEADIRLPRHSEPQLRFHSLILCPMTCRGQIYGVLAVANRTDNLPFNRADLELLEVIASQAAFSLHSAILLKMAAEKQKLDHEVDVAGEIQRILLPDCAPLIPGYHIAGENIAAQRLSGDYYDFFTLPDGKLGIAIADVSGKGLPASLIMTMCRAILRSHASLCASPADVLRAVNRQIQPDMQKDMFVTMIYAVLDPTKNLLILARAGHEQPLLWRRGHAELIKSPGMAVGIDSGEIFDLSIQDFTLNLEPGDLLLLYTDGVTEAHDIEHQEFGREALKQCLCTAAGEDCRNILQNIIRRISRFRGEAPIYDDITLIAIQRDPLPEIPQDRSAQDASKSPVASHS